MASFDFRLNTASLSRKLNHIRNGYGSSPEGEELIKKSSAEGMKVAIKEAPRGDTGNLKRAIQLVPIKKSGSTVEGGFDVNIKYAAPQNFGFVHNRSGRFIEGKFFMEKGYLATEEYAKRNMKKSLQKFMSRG